MGGAQSPELENMTSIKFVDWDNRPAVLVGDKAFAVLKPGEAWVSVDRSDVRETGGVMSEVAWRRRFAQEFGHLDVLRWRLEARQAQKPDYSSMSELAWAQKYQRAAWEDTPLALHATLREHQAFKLLEDLPNADKPCVLGFPGVAALNLSLTLRQVGADMADGQLMLYGADMERRARAVIGHHLSRPSPNETAQ
jgi:hypothetical protein